MEDEIHESIDKAIVEMRALCAENAAMEGELSIGRELLDRAIKARDTAESMLATITAERDAVKLAADNWLTKAAKSREILGGLIGMEIYAEKKREIEIKEECAREIKKILERK
jgi:hypothetical protein